MHGSLYNFLPIVAKADGLDGPVGCSFVAVGDSQSLSASAQKKIASIPGAR